jgi:hypothetical protein
MNATMVAMEQGLGVLTVGEVLALLGLPSKQAAKQQLSPSVDDVVKSIGELLSGLIVRVIEKRTAGDFQTAAHEAFPIYARVMIALSGVITSVVPPNVIERITAESFSELEADLRDHALLAFGASVQSQAIFTVWTLRKINDLSHQISSAHNLSNQLKERDGDFAKNFAYHVLRARFNLDCLSASMHSHQKHPIYPDVLEVLMDGLRSAVNAYAWIRQGLDLRFPVEEPNLPAVEWDDEDRALLNASTQDMLSDMV